MLWSAVMKSLRVQARWPVLVFGLMGSLSAAAHDFWIQPDEFWVQPQARAPLTLQIGHGPLRQRSPIRLRRITRFEAIAPDGATIDLRERLHPGNGTEDGELRFEHAGTYVLVLETDNGAQSHLPAIRFNDYAKIEGLSPALEQRRRDGRMNADGSESYSRRTKAIVQVGQPGAASQAHVVTPLGLPLEIVPERSPYAEPRSSVLPVRVIYQGRPLAAALVKLTDLQQDEEPFETRLTDAAGRAVFTMPSAGSWLLNVIWTQPLPRSAETDFDTIFASLSFGFPAPRR
jgi:uncharacterized GH25 family protein